MFFLKLLLKNFTSDARTNTVKQAQEYVEFLFHRENGLDTRTSEASTNGSWSNFSFFLSLLLCLLHHFSWQQNMNLKTKECCWAVFFINQWKHLFWVHSWFYQDGRSRRKFEERVSETVCLFPVFFMMVPFSLDTRSLCLFLCLFIIPVLIGVPWPHRTFFGVNFLHCLYLVPVPVVLFNPGNPKQKLTTTRPCRCMFYRVKTSGLKKLSLILSE